MDRILALNPAAPGSSFGVIKKILDEECLNVPEFYQQHCCLESGQQRLDSVDQTHLVLEGGNLAQQKRKNINEALNLCGLF